MPSLPELTHREIVKMLQNFGCPPKNQDAPQLKGKTASGKPYWIDIHPSQKMRPETLSNVLNRLEISKDRFWDWYNGGRK